MALIDNVSNAAWVAVGPLATAERWQCRSGAVQITWETVVDDRQGHVLQPLMSIDIPTGKTVSYRATGSTFTEATRINREAI